MTVLVLAPVLKVLEQGVDLVVRVPLQMPVDADVPPVADLYVARPSSKATSCHVSAGHGVACHAVCLCIYDWSPCLQIP